MNSDKPNDNFSMDSGDGDGQQKHRRRVRYSGTHPKRFGHKYKELQPDKYPDVIKHLRAKGKTPAGTHIPVLVEETIACLRPKPGDIVADCTIGYGGHAAEFMKCIGPTGKLIGFDVDGGELERTRERLGGGNVSFSLYHKNFAGIANILADEGIGGYDIIFADLGVSSMQVDNPARGISYKNKGPLDMRMDDRLRQTGADLLTTLSEEELSKALLELSDEPDHKRIARLIVTERNHSPITQVSQLVRLILKAKNLTPQSWRKQQLSAGFGALHPAARTFQAIRILVNDELGSLRELLRVAPFCLKPGGKIGIISFHSGEDRLVKQSFRQGVRNGIYQSATPNPIVPRVREIAANPRSSSAKFRWAKKTS
jgi:16S rRNA (cytosine1402-N4)-methyltransferase